ncbi:transcriptional regulator [Antrihabitans sp. NCIMB 15449]|uniref:Transcriptional regulator n=1 Tax=Antrihabitans spumae TaxID=3373370 RepID=A0ABW7JVH8_9NOCA
MGVIDGLDPLIHAPKRLAAMAVLANAPTASFSFLREHLALTDSDLSKQMSALEAAGYVVAAKSGHGRGSTTTYRMTKTGKAAFTRHREALRALLDS